MGVQRRNHEARAGHRDDHIDVIGLQSRALQTLFRRFPAQLHRMLDIFVIRLRKRARLDGVVEREDSVPVVNLRVINDAHHRLEAALRDVKDAAHVDLHVLARDGIGRERRGRGGDRGMRSSCFYGSIDDGFHQSPWAQGRR